MERNVADMDRVLRGAAAIAAVVAAFVVGPTTVVGITLAVLAVVLGGTAAAGFCPIYRLFGISTCRLPVRK